MRRGKVIAESIRARRHSPPPFGGPNIFALANTGAAFGGGSATDRRSDKEKSGEPSSPSPQARVPRQQPSGQSHRDCLGTIARAQFSKADLKMRFDRVFGEIKRSGYIPVAEAPRNQGKNLKLAGGHPQLTGRPSRQCAGASNRNSCVRTIRGDESAGVLIHDGPITLEGAIAVRLTIEVSIEPDSGAMRRRGSPAKFYIQSSTRLFTSPHPLG